MGEFDAGANRLGALALRIADRLQLALTADGKRSASAATALCGLHNFLDAPTIEQLAAVLGLSSSGTVRLVDGLVEDGLVTRSRGSDARETTVALTRAGRRAAKRMVDARAAVLADVLSPLSTGERAIFDDLLDRMLVGIVDGSRAKGWMCRLCDTATCGAERGQPCPITKPPWG